MTEVVFKVEHNGTVRRVRVVPSFDALVAALSPEGAFRLHYVDDEGDDVVVRTDGDLAEAMAVSKDMGRPTTRLVMSVDATAPTAAPVAPVVPEAPLAMPEAPVLDRASSATSTASAGCELFTGAFEGEAAVEAVEAVASPTVEAPATAVVPSVAATPAPPAPLAASGGSSTANRDKLRHVLALVKELRSRLGPSNPQFHLFPPMLRDLADSTKPSDARSKVVSIALVLQDVGCADLIPKFRDVVDPDMASAVDEAVATHVAPTPPAPVASPGPAPGSWDCPMCTYTNSPADTKCFVCSTANPAAAAPSATAPPAPSAPPAPVPHSYDGVDPRLPLAKQCRLVTSLGDVLSGVVRNTITHKYIIVQGLASTSDDGKMFWVWVRTGNVGGDPMTSSELKGPFGTIAMVVERFTATYKAKCGMEWLSRVPGTNSTSWEYVDMTVEAADATFAPSASARVAGESKAADGMSNNRGGVEAFAATELLPGAVVRGRGRRKHGRRLNRHMPVASPPAPRGHYQHSFVMPARPRPTPPARVPASASRFSDSTPAEEAELARAMAASQAQAREDAARQAAAREAELTELARAMSL